MGVKSLARSEVALTILRSPLLKGVRSPNFDSTLTTLKFFFMCMLSKLCYLYSHLFLKKILIRLFNLSITKGHISHFPGFLKYFTHFSIFFVPVTLFFQHFLHGPKLTKLHDWSSKMLEYQKQSYHFYYLSL